MTQWCRWAHLGVSGFVSPDMATLDTSLATVVVVVVVPSCSFALSITEKTKYVRVWDKML